VLKSGVLLSVLAHLLLLRVLVAGSGVVEPPARACRELPVTVSLAAEPIEPPGMPEAVSLPTAAAPVPVEAETVADSPGIEASPLTSEPPGLGAPVAEAELGSSQATPAAVEVVAPTGIFTPDVPPLKLNDRRWEGEVKVGVYVTPEGRPGKVWVIESSGRREADLDALAFFAETLWRPATVNGEPVGWVLERTVAYRQPAYFP
jgi:TonB family protein